jgi:hypothetical protein
MRLGTKAVEVPAGDLRNFQTQAETQGDPVAEGLAQFSLTPGEVFVPRPNPLASGYFTPITAVVFDDLIDGYLHRGVKVAG